MFYFKVSYAQKDSAKKMGAKWDPDTKQWYAPNEQIRKLMIEQKFNACEPQEAEIQQEKSGTLCYKCRKFFCSNMTFERTCGCIACVPCIEKLGTASHVFMCERYGHSID